MPRRLFFSQVSKHRAAQNTCSVSAVAIANTCASELSDGRGSTLRF